MAAIPNEDKISFVHISTISDCVLWCSV